MKNFIVSLGLALLIVSQSALSAPTGRCECICGGGEGGENYLYQDPYFAVVHRNEKNAWTNGWIGTSGQFLENSDRSGSGFPGVVRSSALVNNERECRRFEATLGVCAGYQTPDAYAGLKAEDLQEGMTYGPTESVESAYYCEFKSGYVGNRPKLSRPKSAKSVIAGTPQNASRTEQTSR